MRKLWYVYVFFIAVIIVLSYISIVNPYIPFTFDEAWNFTDLSRHGPLYAMTRYPFPNNHVLFTVLQSIAIPVGILPQMPYVLRLLNVIVCAVFFLLIYLFFTKKFRTPPLFSLFAAVSCFLVSPLVTPYVIISRGYILGSVLLCIGIYFLAEKKYIRAVIPFALSVWTVPTFLYALPFLYCVVLFLSGRKKILLVAITGSAVAAIDFLLYLPIMKYILASTNQWTTYSFPAFFRDTLQSLSNYSFIPHGTVLHVLYIILYAVSLWAIAVGEKHADRKRLFLYGTIAIAGYILIVWLLSLFDLAQPPFMRNGLFIPIVCGMTIFYGITRIPIFPYRFLAWCICIGNIFAGGYLFVTLLPYTPTHPYPYVLDQSPLSKPKSELFKEIQEGTIIVNRPSDSAALKYYSIIYNKELVDYVPPTASRAAGLQTAKKDSEKPAKLPDRQKTAKQNTAPFLLPDNPLYIGKRLWQHMMLQAYDVFILSKKPKIRYLNTLSDTTYAESIAVWNKGKRTLALQTIAKAEHFVTLMTPEIHMLSNFGDTDKQLYEEIETSIAEHLQILSRLLSSSTEPERQILLSVQTNAVNNLQTITFLIGK